MGFLGQRNRIFPFLLFASVVTLLAASPGPGHAAPGDLDPTFGSAGIVTLTPTTSSHANALAVQGDGKIVVAGYGITTSPGLMVVARLDASGVPDPAFGPGGFATIPGPVQSIAYAVALQPGGEIVVAGASLTPTFENDYQLARLLPANGQLDSTFGSGGIVITTANSSDGRGALALQADGKIVLGGATKRRASASILSNRDFLVVRYLSDGTPDPAFGSEGRARINLGGRADAIAGVVIQADGSIVVGGHAVSKRKARFALARLDASGVLDRSFATRGRFRRELLHKREYGRGITSLPDGSIVAGGISIVQAEYPQRGFPTLAQLTPSGALDPAFGTAGVAGLDPGAPASHFANAIVRQGDGKIVLAGSVNGPTGEPTGGILLTRTLADGSPDPSFGAAGTVMTPVGDQATAHAVALQADGKIVVAGFSVSGGQSRIIVARYLP